MAKNDKSEKATDHKRAEARKDGQVPRSAEVQVLAGLLVSVLVLRVLGPQSVGAIAEQTTRAFSQLSADELPTRGQLLEFGAAAAATLGPFLLAAVAAALTAGFGQTRGNVSGKAARPKLKNLDPRKGMEKLKPSKSLWELFRTLTKLLVLIVAVWNPLLDVRDLIVGGTGIDAGVRLIADQTWIVLVRGIGVAFVVAAADYAYQRWQHEKQLRMSKQDIRDEHKSMDGDPMMKGERRRRAQEMSRNRMLSDVGTADVVLVNPTEYAVALRYEQDEPAPRVVAKGMDHLARRIREEAVSNGVPVRVDVVLTRTLHRQVTVGAFVPEDLYEAIAVVLVWAFRRRPRRPSASSTVGAPGTAPVAAGAAAPGSAAARAAAARTPAGVA